MMGHTNRSRHPQRDYRGRGAKEPEAAAVAGLEAHMTTRTALHELRAADLMQRDLITVNVDDAMREVERVLVDAQVSSVPVLDDVGTVLGVVSMRDVVTRYAAEGHAGHAGAEDDEDTDDFDWRRDDEPCAGDLMTTDLHRVTPATSLARMAQIMVAGGAHRVLVVEDGKLVGLVSSMDVLRAVAEHDAD
jgi:CBS domain-containing protein